jgi:DNA primase
MARLIPDKILSGEYRRALLDRFFEAGRRPMPAAGARREPWQGGGGKGAGKAPWRREPPMGVPGLQRHPIDQPGIRLDRARNLLAILLRHPLLLPEVEEALMALDLPEGDCQALRGSLLAWLGGAELLDSAALARHLAQDGMENAAIWATQAPGLCAAAHPAAQPKEALDGWWHFFGLLRGEAELIEDRAEAQRLLVETNDPAAQQRLIRLSEALAVLRGGGPEESPDEEASQGSSGATGTPQTGASRGDSRADTIG